MADSASMSQRHDGVFLVKRLVLRVHLDEHEPENHSSVVPRRGA